MITRYPDSTEFEKENYVKLEKKYLNKIIGKEYIIKKYIFYNLNRKSDKIFYKMFFNKKNLNIIKQYLEEKNRLAKPKYISESEKKRTLYFIKL